VAADGASCRRSGGRGGASTAAGEGGGGASIGPATAAIGGRLVCIGTSAM
jgi:hypothetical protein